MKVDDVHNKEAASSSEPCRIEEATISSIQEASVRLQQNKLVAFPTETVYGLGANALSVDAVLKIFSAKGRPLTDPLIVHVRDKNHAEELVEFESNEQQQIFNLLAETFWPGPLTIILKANLSKIPNEVTANTGFVGVRVPKHRVISQLLQKCGLPIAAPSANRFGHVSPTTAAHVFNDLNHYDLLILQDSDHEHKVCQVGIESTVLKIENSTDPNTNNQTNIIVYRQGGVPLRNLKELLLTYNTSSVNITTHKKNKTNGEMNCPAPGQEIKHYAPEIDTYLLSGTFHLRNFGETLRLNINGQVVHLDPRVTVFIDFSSSALPYKSFFLAYFDLSPSGNADVAASELFTILRRAETISKARVCLIVDVSNFEGKALNEATLPAVYDRIFRAASGQIAYSTPRDMQP